MFGGLDQLYVHTGTMWRFPLVKNAVVIEGREEWDKAKVAQTRTYLFEKFSP